VKEEGKSKREEVRINNEQWRSEQLTMRRRVMNEKSRLAAGYRLTFYRRAGAAPRACEGQPYFWMAEKGARITLISEHIFCALHGRVISFLIKIFT
jgi:hypothetical protein